jgi:hypothetical protein
MTAPDLALNGTEGTMMKSTVLLVITFAAGTGYADDAKQPPPPPATEAKPAEAKPAEAKPAEAKPTEAKPAEAKPTEAKPAEAKPAEAKPAEAKPAEAKPAEAKPAEAKPAEAKPAEAKPAVAKPAEAKPAEAKPAVAKPAEAKPAVAKPAEAKPAVAKPKDAPKGTSGAAAEVKAGTGIEKREIVGEATTFPAGTTVWVWSRITNGGGKIKHVWKHDGKDAWTVVLPVGSKLWSTASRRPIRAAGSWQVDVQTEAGASLGTVSFTIQ